MTCVNLLCVSLKAQRFLHHRYKNDWMSVQGNSSPLVFFFHHWSKQKPHTKPWKPLSKSTTRQSIHWSSCLEQLEMGAGRVDDVTDSCGHGGAKNGDLPTTVFDTSSSMWRKRLTCLSFVLKLVSRQKMILGWSSPLNLVLFSKVQK